MNATKLSLCVAAVVFLCTAAMAANRTAATVDCGGGRTTSSSYVVDCSIGDQGGSSGAAHFLLKSGYIGQLFETRTLEIVARETANEGSSFHLGATATLDDHTNLKLDPGEIAWSCVSNWPISSISVSGLAVATNVYQDTLGLVAAEYAGMECSRTLWILNSNSDDFGLYANDGIPDTWQVQYFGVNNPYGMAEADFTQTGQNNWFKYIAGLNPTNSGSKFVFEILTVTNQPAKKLLVFSPRYENRTYTTLFRTDFDNGLWNTLTNLTIDDQGNVRTIIDNDQSSPKKFYRINISLP